MQLIQSTRIVSAITPTEGAAGQTAIKSAVLDMAGATGALFAVRMGAITTGAVTSLKLQDADEPAEVLSVKTLGTTANELREGATTNVKLGAKFTVGAAATQVKEAHLRLKRQGAVTAGKVLTVTIQNDNSGTPGTTVLGTAGTIDASTLSTSEEWVKFTFANPVDLVAETVYHVVLAGDYDASGTVNVIWMSNTVASAGNCSKFDDTNWAATATEDLEVFTRDFAFSDLTGTAQTIADSKDGEIFYVDISKPRKRYLRMAVSRGTQNAVIADAVALVYGNGNSPVTQDSGVNGETHVSPARGTA